jgi:hypothetical protein
VGAEKRDLMGVQFTEAELEQQRRIKGAFDPGWLLNPGKVFPLAGNKALAVLHALSVLAEALLAVAQPLSVYKPKR